jgi:hypothetical protein
MGIKGVLLAMSVAAAAVSPAWAINKCTGADGKVVFQDAPCTDGGKSETLMVRPASGRGNISPVATTLPPDAPSNPEPAPSQSAPQAQVPQASAQPAKSTLEVEADMCLAWYRPLLRDPKGAYYTHLKKEQRVFTMELHATNGYGGYVVKIARCEIHNGKLNEAWTKNHAKRAGWSVE